MKNPEVQSIFWTLFQQYFILILLNHQRWITRLSARPPYYGKQQQQLQEDRRVLLFVSIYWQVETEAEDACALQALSHTIKHGAVWSWAHKQVLLVRTGLRWNSWGVQ